MDIKAKKQELMDWLLHLNDTSIINRLDKLRKQVENKPAQGQPIFGRLKGKIKMSPDFDAPLEDFKNYQ
jgi:hypothetical protein